MLLRLTYGNVAACELAVLEAVKNCAIELLKALPLPSPTAGAGAGAGEGAAASSGGIYPRYSALFDAETLACSSVPPTSEISGELIAAMVKMLNEDVATLRRVGRVPDSGGINGKIFLKSGK